MRVIEIGGTYMDEKRDFGAYTDNQIVDMFWARDEEAISVTDGKYGRYLYKLAYNVIRDEDDSRSALDDTYFGAWNSIPPSRPERLLLYLSKIARRVSIDLFRRRTAKKRIASELITSLDELSECVASDADTERGIGGLLEALNAFLGSLDARRRRMFVCRYYFPIRWMTSQERSPSAPPTFIASLARFAEGSLSIWQKRGWKCEKNGKKRGRT